MIVATYNHHVRLLCSSPLVVCASKVYPGLGADIVMESLHSSCQAGGFEFPWACGPPMEMKAASPRPTDSKPVKARLSTECNGLLIATVNDLNNQPRPAAT